MAKVITSPIVKKPYHWQGTDPVFFHKSQLKSGTRLINFGRLYHGEVYEVIGIRTWQATKLKRVDSVQRLSDEISLYQVDTHATRVLTFSTLSYSAIWRIL